MKKTTFQFSTKSTDFYFDASFDALEELVKGRQFFVITDENIFAKHKKKFANYKMIVLPAGEQFKTQTTVDKALLQLIEAGADRKSLIIGVGGGVVTDITGYIASIYMRGVAFGFVPTSILAMVDAAIGGKNGIDVGLYKNMVGIINQPEFLLYDASLLKTLPTEEWINGFAEIIKHACIKDAPMFKQLQEKKLSDYKKDLVLLSALIKRNALIKAKVVQEDEFEQGERKQLNFGHTLGHAIENMLEIKHGEAIAIGMVAASVFSEQLIGFKGTAKVVEIFEQYGLPTNAAFDKMLAFSILQKDKKKEMHEINYVLLEKIGKAVVKKIDMKDLFEMLEVL